MEKTGHFGAEEGDMNGRGRFLHAARIAALVLVFSLFVTNMALADGPPVDEGATNGLVSDLVEALKTLWYQGGLKLIVVHVLVNVVVALAASLKTGEFVLAKTGEFLYRKLLPYVAVYAVCYFVGDATGLGFIGGAALVAIETGLMGDLLDSAIKLGLELPDRVHNLIVKPEPDFEL